MNACSSAGRRLSRQLLGMCPNHQDAITFHMKLVILIQVNPRYVAGSTSLGAVARSTKRLARHVSCPEIISATTFRLLLFRNCAA